ncbi:hypothetical protein BDZ89DRAFT_1142017 [Hymenopellis radicata]|nr:hypothetical protein BDZ89DRAFT_1142015 [Hymenopellis radicata]KAF9014790.1 hypothetical protein BDZ89DRAFT_1142017 [Hymenopellis radicata]
MDIDFDAGTVIAPGNGTDANDDDAGDAPMCVSVDSAKIQDKEGIPPDPDFTKATDIVKISCPRCLAGEATTRDLKLLNSLSSATNTDSQATPSTSSSSVKRDQLPLT